MIVGIGIDVTQVSRFTASASRPGLLERVFTPAERDASMQRMAGRFAAKEAFAKALGAPTGLVWTDVEVRKDDSGQALLRVLRDRRGTRGRAGHRHHPSLDHPRRRHRRSRGGLRGLMRAGYTVAQIRDAEARAMAVLGPDALMQRAAAGLAAAILRRLPSAEPLRFGRTPVLERRGSTETEGFGDFGGGRGAYGARVLLVVGSGNNGGDALFAGARLARRGVRVTAWRAGSGVHEAGWQAFLAAGGREVDAAAAGAELSRQRCVVDGVAGIGSRPGLAPALAGFVAACREHDVPVVAVDLPSGLAPEPPFPESPHVIAALTVTFGGYKLCQLMEPARSECGEIELVDIGLDLPEPAVSQWEPSDVAASWPVPDARSDKYSRGVVGLDTGSLDYPGAAVLTAAGAVAAGAGMVRYLGPAPVANRVIDRFPNVVAAPGRVQALVVGSGWGDRVDAGAIQRAVDSGLPLVVDADGLRHLPGPGARRRPVDAA